MPKHLVEPTGHSTRALVSGTWVTPSATRPTLVIIKLTASSVTGGDLADFDIELRDTGDIAVTGYPLSTVYDRGAGALGNNNLEAPFTILVPTGYDYRVVDNSSGVTTTLNAVEDVI